MGEHHNNLKQTIMNTPTKKTWQSLITIIAEEIEHAEWEVRDVQEEAEQRINNTKNTVDWDWEWYTRNGTPVAYHWDDATEEHVQMLDYAAKFNHAWPEVRKKILQARQLLQVAYAELILLRKED